MKITHEEVHRVSLLARVGLTEAEVEKMSRQLSDILENFEVLKQVDTANVLPTAQPIARHNVMRDDEIETSLTTGDVLANAPRKEDEFIRVWAILDQHSS
jgi:aspartyl-tRNA(Asn)/glutamyl-tRNA(Gln) amidotransferase subunit C